MTDLEKMNEGEIRDALKNHPDWNEVGGELQRTFQFDDFAASIVFVNRVAEAAEKADHHPDILIRYNKVTLTISTHDAGGITEKDFDLAERADSFLS